MKSTYHADFHMIKGAPKRARRWSAWMKNHIPTVESAGLVAGRKCGENQSMTLADDLIEPSPDMAPIAMNLGGNMPFKDLPTRHGDGSEVQEVDQEFHHGFVGYDE